MRYLASCVLGAVALAACGQDRIDIIKSTSNDYGHAALHQAIDEFVAAGRTPVAYRELAAAVFALRPGMDKAVSRDAELKLVTLGLAPVRSVAKETVAARIQALALTVWPALLASPIEADEILRKREPKDDEVLARPGEDVAVWLTRICGGPLAGECRHVVPERQGEIVSALALRRATERARNAVADCALCATEPGWKAAVVEWELLDHDAGATLKAIEDAGEPARWPVAGPASDADPRFPEAQLLDSGELVVDGKRHGAPTRVEALRALRGAGTDLALHVRPEVTLAQLRGLYTDARKAGATKIALVARHNRYPWERRIYWLVEGTNPSTLLRPTDPVQLLLHAADHLTPTAGSPVRIDLAPLR
ncbi:MAG: hypothetical protein KF773_35095 [Deltaproteobacteria bacterium]|nr:hypothetical protein [Deltaproteobacteria bacterium]